MPSSLRAVAGDSTFAFMSDPYRFISRRSAALLSDVFETRVLLRPVICMVGSEAAALLYDEDLFERHGAAPEPVAATLFGRGGVQSLDGEAHRDRKRFFVDLLSAPALAALSLTVLPTWRSALARCPAGGTLPLYETAQQVFARTAFEWTGAMPPEHDIPLRCRQLVCLFDGAARGPLRHLGARRARASLEAWLAQQVDAVRAGSTGASPGSALAQVSVHTDRAGRSLSSREAAVELLNVLRPVVAVSVYVVLAAHAVLGFPSLASGLGSAEPSRLRHFIDEVRRYYPFFPVLAARVRRRFDWQEFDFTPGRRVLLEIYGTHHDARAWKQPARFDPARFARGEVPPYAFLPQGGGDVRLHHRCPGEDTVMVLATVTLAFLLREARLRREGSDARIDFGRLPALPRARISVAPLRPG